jgi:hypothetical protein
VSYLALAEQTDVKSIDRMAYVSSKIFGKTL